MCRISNSRAVICRVLSGEGGAFGAGEISVIFRLKPSRFAMGEHKEFRISGSRYVQSLRVYASLSYGGDDLVYNTSNFRVLWFWV